MQGAAQRPSADDAAIGERLLDAGFRGTCGAQTKGPERAWIILRLHGAEPFHDVGRRGKARAGKTLGKQALLGDAAFARSALRRTKTASARTPLRRAGHYGQIPRRRRNATIWPM